MYLYLKKGQSCVSVQECVWESEDVIPALRRKLIFPAAPTEKSPEG